MERNYVNRTKKMNNGMKATIIRQRKYTDIDVQFEDGTVVYNKTVEKFLTGKIKYPKVCYFTDEEIKEKYIGKNEVMNNGMKATIINFRREDDIDVQFEDGEVIKHTSVQSFENKKIKHPIITSSYLKEREKYIGMTNTLVGGLRAIVIDYKPDKTVEIEFENGIIAHNVGLSSFLYGSFNLYANRYNPYFLDLESEAVLNFINERITEDVFASSASFCEELFNDEDEEFYFYLAKKMKKEIKEKYIELMDSNDLNFALWLTEKEINIQKMKIENKRYELHIQIEDLENQIEKENSYLNKLNEKFFVIKNLVETKENIVEDVDTRNMTEITEEKLLDILMAYDINMILR